jgi:hypothetical protein
LITNIKACPQTSALDKSPKLLHLPLIREPVPREHVNGPDEGSHRTQGFRGADGVFAGAGIRGARRSLFAARLRH